jgi:hypothetical protein
MWGFFPWGIALYPLTPYWQSNAFLAPFLYAIKGIWWPITLLGVFLINQRAVIIKNFKLRMDLIPDMEMKEVSWRKLIVAVKVFGYNVAHCLFPRRIAFFQEFLEDYGITKAATVQALKPNRRFRISILGLIAYLIIMVLYWKEPLGFGLFWWLLFSVQWFHFPVSVTQMSDRQYYLPNAGLMLAMAYIISLCPYPLAVFAIYLTYLATKTWEAMPQYRNMDAFYEQVLRVYPKQFRIWYYSVGNLLKGGMLHHAYVYVCEGLKNCPNDFELNFQAAEICLWMGREDAMIDKFIKRAEANLLYAKEAWCKQRIANLNALRERVKKEGLKVQIQDSLGEI